MKRTICEKLMWSAMTPTIFEYIASEFQNIDVAGKKKEAKRIYLDMVKRTSDIQDHNAGADDPESIRREEPF